MNWRKEWKKLAAMVLIFLVCFYLPIDWPQFKIAIFASLKLVKWYAQEHVLLCLVPAFFIAGAVGVFVSRESVMKYLGASAPKPIAYAVAAVSGTILAVCSCTILPLFAGIYKMGAGLGPACAFLYSGPAINILAIVLTARILGPELGIARAVGAVLFSVVIGLAMHFLFRHEEQAKAVAAANLPKPEGVRPLSQTILFFASMVGVLVFANWGKPTEGTTEGVWVTLYANKWAITAGFASLFGVVLALWYGLGWLRVGLVAAAVAVAAVISTHATNLDPYFVPIIPFAVGFVGLSIITSTHDDESGEWFSQSWFFAKQILPLLLGGVLVSGILLGLPKSLGGDQGLIPQEWVTWAVGGNSLTSNFFASFLGAFMYFATLTEVPILQGLIENGMGQGPALALLLAGPALSLPSMLVINSVLGPKKTLAFVSLVVIMATISGMIYGSLAASFGWH